MPRGFYISNKIYIYIYFIFIFMSNLMHLHIIYTSRNKYRQLLKPCVIIVALNIEETKLLLPAK